MPDLGTLQDLIVLLLLALVSGYLFSRLRLSPIIGYLACGVLAGPHALHLIGAVHEVEIMAEIGVILLLFTIGLEFSFTRLLKLKRLMLVSGTLQVFLTAALVFVGHIWLDLKVTTVLVLAAALALSSTAIVLKLLNERGEMDTAHGRSALAILLFQDICVVFFLVALPLLGGSGNGFSWPGLLQALALLAGLALFARYLLKPLLRAVLQARSQELFRVTVLVLVLATAWVTAKAGLSLALGAFLAGLALAESPYSHQALADILPFRDTFLAIFFISVGMLVDLRMLAENWPAVLALFLVLSLVKVGTATVATLAAGHLLRVALVTGLLLFQVGEFSFVLLKQALSLELIPAGPYQVALSVIALSMLATPLLAPHAGLLAGRIADRLGGRGLPEEGGERTANLEGHVVIAGYGLSGRNVGRVLRMMRIPYLFIELNGESVRAGRQAGEFIFYGDATAPPVLEELGIERARSLVLAINDPGAAVRAVRAARQLNPELFILARSRYVAELDYLREQGADEVVPDELEASLQLSAFLLRRFGIAEGRVMQHLSRLRREHYSRLLSSGSADTAESHPLSVLEGGQVDYLALPEDSPCLDRSLAELAFRNRTGAMVMAVIRKERTLYNISPDFRLERGDTLMLLGSAEEIQKARDLLRGKETS